MDKEPLTGVQKAGVAALLTVGLIMAALIAAIIVGALYRLVLLVWP